MVDVSGSVWVPHWAAVFEVWTDQTPIGLMDWGIDFKFLLMSKLSLLFALFTILLMCGFQERLFAMSMPRYVATGITLRL